MRVLAGRVVVGGQLAVIDGKNNCEILPWPVWRFFSARCIAKSLTSSGSVEVLVCQNMHWIRDTEGQVKGTLSMARL